MGVSRETRERLVAYAVLIRTWSPRINLVAKGTLVDLESRHIADCLQLSELLDGTEDPVVDLGSGAGLPGLVISIAAPGRRVICVESDQRKCVFLREVIRRLDLSARVVTNRIEAAAPLQSPTIVARGLAPLPRLLDYVARHGSDGGAAYLMKGRRWQEELEAARQTWHFSHEAVSSRTDPHAVTLLIRGLSRA